MVCGLWFRTWVEGRWGEAWLVKDKLGLYIELNTILGLRHETKGLGTCVANRIMR